MSAAPTEQPSPDPLLVDIVNYVTSGEPDSTAGYETAGWCLMDSLGCAMLAASVPACGKLLGPVVPGAELPGGARVPGTSYELDPVKAAFDIGSMVRWLDYNDTWLAAEWGHPSDNLGAILACADYVSRRRIAEGGPPLVMREVLTAMIQAYEIQGVLALDYALNRVGLDHVFFVRVASTAVAARLLGATPEQITSALSHAWADGGALRTYRHAPNTGSRKSWAAGDATSRGVRLALIALTGEMGYPTILSAKRWGVADVVFGGREIRLARPLETYVIRNVLFKVYPAEFHAQTALEAAIKLHPRVDGWLDRIDRIIIDTQESAMRIIDKTGPLRNPADRDHCLQYIVAVGLIHGTLRIEHYEDAAAGDPRIDGLREKMQVVESAPYSRDYLDPGKRSIANAVQILFKDGSSTDRVEVEYPLGHPRRRDEAVPLLTHKFESNLATRLPKERCGEILAIFDDPHRLGMMPVHLFMDLFQTLEGS